MFVDKCPSRLVFLTLVPTSTPLKFLKNWVFAFSELSFSKIELSYLRFPKARTEFFRNRNWVVWKLWKFPVSTKKNEYFHKKVTLIRSVFLDLVPTSTPLKFLKNWVFPFFSWVLWKYLSFVGKLGTEFFESRNWVFRFCSKNKTDI